MISSQPRVKLFMMPSNVTVTVDISEDLLDRIKLNETPV